MSYQLHTIFLQTSYDFLNNFLCPSYNFLIHFLWLSSALLFYKLLLNFFWTSYDFFTPPPLSKELLKTSCKCHANFWTSQCCMNSTQPSYELLRTFLQRWHKDLTNIFIFRQHSLLSNWSLNLSLAIVTSFLWTS